MVSKWRDKSLIRVEFNILVLKNYSQGYVEVCKSQSSEEPLVAGLMPVDIRGAITFFQQL